jgi:hypothetical protein
LAKCGNPTNLLIIFSFLTLLSSKFGPNRAWRRSSRSNYRRFGLSKRGDIAPQTQLQWSLAAILSSFHLLEIAQGSIDVTD